MKTIISLATAVLLIAGCAAIVEKSGKEIEGDPEKIIRTGVTTREEIIKAFGTPSSSSAKDGSEELVYESREEETPAYLGGLVVNKAGKTVTVKHLEIVIQNGVVQSYKYKTGGE